MKTPLLEKLWATYRFQQDCLQSHAMSEVCLLQWNVSQTACFSMYVCNAKCSTFSKWIIYCLYSTYRSEIPWRQAFIFPYESKYFFKNESIAPCMFLTNGSRKKLPFFPSSHFQICRDLKPKPSSTEKSPLRLLAWGQIDTISMEGNLPVCVGNIKYIGTLWPSNSISRNPFYSSNPT